MSRGHGPLWATMSSWENGASEKENFGRGKRPIFKQEKDLWKENISFVLSAFRARPWIVLGNNKNLFTHFVDYEAFISEIFKKT